MSVDARFEPDGDALRPRRNLRLITLDGAVFSVMVGAGEAYVPAFALFAGLRALDAGLVATLPMLAGAALGLASGRAVRALRSHRTWVVLAALVQALAFGPLAWGAWTGHAPRVLVYGAATAYWAGGLATGPAWNTWVATVVPSSVRARYFGRRARVVQASVLLGLVVAGVLLEHAPDAATRARVFALVFAGAGLMRLLSAALLQSTDEPQPLPATLRTVRPRDLLRRLRHGSDGRLFAYLVVLQASVNVASPFFTPFMLRELALGYGLFMALTATTYVAKVAASPWLGDVARALGPQRLLVAGGLGIAFVPLLWLVSTDLWWLFLAQAVSGFSWAAHELASTLLFLDAIDSDERTSLLSVFNVANALAVAVGALFGSVLLAWIGPGPAAYLTVFLTSGLARIVALPLVRHAGVPLPREVQAPVPTRVLAIRPTSGPLERPILPTVDALEEEVAAAEEGPAVG